MNKLTSGTSLLEALVCIAVLSIVCQTAIPAMNQLLDNQIRQSATMHMLGALRYSRGQAILRRERISICHGLGSCALTGNWSQQLLIFTDHNSNGTLDNDDVLLRQQDLDKSTYWLWSGFRGNRYIQFESDGTTLAFNGTFTLCMKGKPEMQIVINIAGRTRTQSPPVSKTCL
jgi:type IV fimbrial biogenesis protein FimT